MGENKFSYIIKEKNHIDYKETRQYKGRTTISVLLGNEIKNLVLSREEETALKEFKKIYKQHYLAEKAFYTAYERYKLCPLPSNEKAVEETFRNMNKTGNYLYLMEWESVAIRSIIDKVKDSDEVIHTDFYEYRFQNGCPPIRNYTVVIPKFICFRPKEKRTDTGDLKVLIASLIILAVFIAIVILVQ